MKILAFCAVALVVSAPAFTQVPDTPMITAGAQLKGVRLDWGPTPGAVGYILGYQPHGTGPFYEPLVSIATSARITLPLHLYDWTRARYRVRACNSSGCSISPEVSVSDLRRDAVGYFKASHTLVGQSFGDDLDLAPDGYNFAVAAPGDVIEAADGPHEGGAVYVFRRDTAGVWSQRARLEPTIPPFIESGNTMSVGISASGNTVAVGMPSYLHEEADEHGGEVQVFHFHESYWGRVRVPRVPSLTFGEWVALSDSGYTLAVGIRDATSKIAIYKISGGYWQNVRNIPNSSPGRDEHCGRGVMSRDGSTIAEACVENPSDLATRRDYIRVHSGTNWSVRTDVPLTMSVASNQGYGHGPLALDATGDTIAAQVVALDAPADSARSEVNVYHRSGGVYSQVASLAPGAWRAAAYQRLYGLALALSGDGQTLTVGDTWDNGLGTGPRASPLIAGEARTGAIYISRLTNGWKLGNMVKPNYHPDESQTFGREMALSASGRTLLVGEGLENSGAEGIGGNWANTDAPISGAVWMY